MKTIRNLPVLFFVAAVLFLAPQTRACFGTQLKIAVEPGGPRALAAYAVGFFIAEKTGIEPDFIETPDAGEALAKGRADLALVDEKSASFMGVETREVGPVPGMGRARILLRTEILDDLRFTTVDRTLKLLPPFFSSRAYGGAAADSKTEPKKAAKKAVMDAT